MKLIHAILILFLLLTSCKVTNGALVDRSANKVVSIETGVASWYGPNFHGKKTANGEIFNKRAYTAAHRTLPLGSKVKVKNQTNGKTVIVRINDRGPYAKHRIIDLSQAAAAKLDMIESGIAPVELFLMETSASVLEIEDIKRPSYTIQIASFSDLKNAQTKATQYRDGWVRKIKSNNKVLYRVYVGKFITTAEAERKKAALKAKGVSGYVKQIEN